MENWNEEHEHDGKGRVLIFLLIILGLIRDINMYTWMTPYVAPASTMRVQGIGQHPEYHET